MQSFGLKTYIWNTGLKASLLLACFAATMSGASLIIVVLLRACRQPTYLHQLIANPALLRTDLLLAIALGCTASVIWFAIATLFYQQIISSLLGAMPATRAEQPQLFAILENLCISRGLIMPALAIMPDPSFNALVTGLGKHNATITVTAGLLANATEDELCAVLAHELAHLQNGDARLGVIVSVFVGLIRLVTDFFWAPSWSYAGIAQSKIGLANTDASAVDAAGSILILPMRLISVVLGWALSRNRDYLADAGAVELTKNADAMIMALRKAEVSPWPNGVPLSMRAFLFHDPQGAEDWFPSHPSITDRITTLQSVAGGYDPGLACNLPPSPTPAAASVSAWTHPESVRLG